MSTPVFPGDTEVPILQNIALALGVDPANVYGQTEVPLLQAIYVGIVALIAQGGGGGSGITQLTGDGTAGPGSGSQALTVTKSNGVPFGTGAFATVPKGADTQIQYNDGGVLAADSNFTWNKTSKVFSVGNGTQSWALTGDGTGIVTSANGGFSFKNFGILHCLSAFAGIGFYDVSDTTQAGTVGMDGSGNLGISCNGSNRINLLATGGVTLVTLPNSNAGLATGALYTTAGAVMQVP